ncbi:MAG: hypothetical protein KAI63_08720, partial [Planctomycetes bacterium]|nr:hypothetical protein [Planctomycetota bacterium]
MSKEDTKNKTNESEWRENRGTDNRSPITGLSAEASAKEGYRALRWWRQIQSYTRTEILFVTFLSFIIFFSAALIIYALVYTWEFDPSTQGGYSVEDSTLIEVITPTGIAQLILQPAATNTHDTKTEYDTSSDYDAGSDTFIPGDTTAVTDDGYVRLAKNPNGGYYAKGINTTNDSTFTSQVFGESGTSRDWQTLTWVSSTIPTSEPTTATIKFQARSGNTNPPSGSFAGPTGTGDYFTSSPGNLELNPGDIPDADFFQYKAYFETDAPKVTPLLESVQVTASPVLSDDTEDSLDEFYAGEFSQTAMNTDYVRLKLRLDTGNPRTGSEPKIVSLWPFDTDATDSKSNNDGTLTNGAVITTTAKFGAGAVAFDGVSGYVSVAHDVKLSFKYALTLESWIKLDSDFALTNTLGSNMTILDKSSSYTLRMDHSSGRLQMELSNYAPSDWVKESVLTVPLIPYGGINAFTEYNGKLYAGIGVGTDFNGLGTVTDFGEAAIFTFDGTDWVKDTDFESTVAPSFERVYSLCVYQGKLYVGLGTENGSGTGDVYTFDGSTWALDYNGSSSIVYSLCVYNGEIYAGDAGGVYKSNGGAWSSTSFTAGYEQVNTLCVYNDLLWAGCGTGTGDGDVVYYDGASWTLDAGLDALTGNYENIHSLCVYNHELYAAAGSGDYDLRGAGEADIFVYDGSSWSIDDDALRGAGKGLDTKAASFSSIKSLGVYNAKLYAGSSWPAYSTQNVKPLIYYPGDAALFFFDGTSWTRDTDMDARLGSDYDEISAFGSYDGKFYMDASFFGFCGFTSPPISADTVFDDKTNVFVKGNNFVISSDTDSWNADQWYHVAGGFDRTSLYLAVDGVKDAESGAVFTIDPNTRPLCIGADMTNNYFIGELDDAAVYKDIYMGYYQVGDYTSPVIASEDNNAIVNWETIAWGEDERYEDQLSAGTGILGLWHMNEDWLDYSGLGNHGTGMN